MRFLMINLILICLFLFGIGYLAFGYAGATDSGTDSYPVGDASLDAAFETFYTLLKTDPEAARVELQRVAKELFNERPLTEEWVELFYQVSLKGTEQNGTEHPSKVVPDVMRVYELGLEMLTAMDPEKYAEEIKGLADSLEQIKFVEKIYERDGMTGAKIPFNPNSADKKSDKESKQKDTSGAPKVSHREKIGKSATDFQVIDLKGQELSLKKYRGQVVLLDFWATWCIPCRAEMPHLKKVYDKYKDQKFEIIGISLDQTRAVLDSYIEKQDITWPQFLENGRAVTKMYNVTGIPATFLIDGERIALYTTISSFFYRTHVHL